MTQKHYDTGLVVGRFQPLHSGHRELIRQAAKRCNRLVIFIGSANLARSIKNPFTYLERKTEISRFLGHEGLENVIVLPLNDYKYSDSQWRSDIRLAMSGFPGMSTCLFGFMKDGNDYLNWFPEYDFENIDTGIPLNATAVREHMYITHDTRIPQTVHDDYAYFEAEKRRFADYPYPETLNFNCADAVVECAGQIVLIRRKYAPGAGSWALPGGFKNRDETFLDCAIRELIEEAGVKVPEKVLRGSIVQSRMFDSPTRGCGIPRNSMMFHIKIDPNHDGSMPKLKPADDALDAEWITIAEALNETGLFDDHGGAVSVLTNTMPIPAHLNPVY